MKRILLILIIILAVAVTASAQDSVKLTFTFQNLNVANNNLPGANGSADVRIGGYGKWRLGAVVDGAYHRDDTRTLDRYQLLGGPQLSYSIGEEGRLSVFGRGLYGVTRFANYSGADFTRTTVGVGGGVDVNVSDHFFIRPAQFDLQWIDQRPVRYTRLGFGGGFRF